jgi:predicted transcriptional regulator of viral defense system
MAMNYFTTRDWVRLLSELPSEGAFLNVSSLRTLTELSEKTARQACWRLSKAGLLRPLSSGWYANSFKGPTLEEVGALLVRPSYISLDRALIRAGATTQPCHVLTCVTTQPTAKKETPYGSIEYRSISRDLFWGFRPRRSPNGLTVFEAEPEKALLDLIYLSRKTGEPIWIDIEFAFLDQQKLNAYARRFPRSVQQAIEPLRRAQSAA